MSVSVSLIGAFMGLFVYVLVIAIIATVAYFVIKKAVKAALVEWEEEKTKSE